MPRSILSELKQYIADALPGGKLNRELTLDVNESPVPRGAAVLRALTGTAPDELGVSVMNPKAAEIRAAAEPAYVAGTALGVTPGLALLKRMLSPARAVVTPVTEHKMLQGMYRGYAGDNPDLGKLGEAANLYYASPQRRVAKIYADRYAKMFGEDPHMEMIMVDPFKIKGDRYPHIPTVTRGDPSTFTMARELLPEEMVSRHQLYARGGLAQYKECSCGHQ